MHRVHELDSRRSPLALSITVLHTAWQQSSTLSIGMHGILSIIIFIIIIIIVIIIIVIVFIIIIIIAIIINIIIIITFMPKSIRLCVPEHNLLG